VSRPRHQKPELEAILRDAESLGWRVIKAKKFKMYCPCDDKHIKTVNLTPLNPNYARELRNQLRRATCWRES
jgi:hypothetical protein